MRAIPGLAAAALLVGCATGGARDARGEDVAQRSIAELSRDLRSGNISSAAITDLYLDRIARLDAAGPRLNAVIATNPEARVAARAADAAGHGGQGPLHGLPILIKDNIETRELPTTAGSLALAANRTGRDAPLVMRLRQAGAIVLGKANLSEWANFRSTASMSGWSTLGGQARNPHALDRSPCGSSSGSGVAVAAGLAAGAIGTETDGSIICPAAMNGVVGFKPSLGLVSRTHIVPIAASQDTAGPITRTVEDAAMLMDAIAGHDPADPVTVAADRRSPGFAAALATDGLRGVRIAVLRAGEDSALTARFNAALAVLRGAGAMLVEVEQPRLEGLGDAEFQVLLTEFKAQLNTYLAGLPDTVAVRDLDALIAFNRSNAARAMPFFAQELLEQAAKTKGLDDPAYKAARAKSLRLAGRDGIDAMLRRARATILVTPSYGQAWPIDPIHGDNFQGPSASRLPAVAGYPHLTVPMGLADGLPVGLSFIGTAGADTSVLRAGHSFERASPMRVVPRYLSSADVGPGLDR